MKRSNSQRGARNTQKKQVSDSTCCFLPVTSPSHIEEKLGGRASALRVSVSALSGGTLWALASWPNWTKSCVPHLQLVYLLTRELDSKRLSKFKTIFSQNKYFYPAVMIFSRKNANYFWVTKDSKYWINFCNGYLSLLYFWSSISTTLYALM